jgi:hypothetical protein
MIVSVHQPQYLPWLGYFDKINRSDAFVFLDCVQYKAREFQNRNKIRTHNNWIWLTVPVLNQDNPYPIISELCIDNKQDWAARHWKAIYLNYAHAPFFKKYSAFFEDLYQQKWERLADLNIHIIESLSKFLKIDKKIYFESKLGIANKSTQRIIDICLKLGADTYLSGIGGKEYLEEKLFERSGIKLLYQEYEHPSYMQRFQPFITDMSVIDLLFNCGEESLEILSPKKS